MGTDDLSLPLLADRMAESPERTLDEIDRWIEQDYALFFDRELFEREKVALSVNEPFRL